MKKKVVSLVLFLLVVFSIQFIGRYFTLSSVNDWYPTLQKPSWNPPSWVFGPVWTLLYLSIAVSGWLVFLKVESLKDRAIAFSSYGSQLLFNLLWSFGFFYQRNPALGLVYIVILTALIIENLVIFAKFYRPAALLLVPYFLWTLFAATLNYSIWRMN